jgi:hypothetical protein
MMFRLHKITFFPATLEALTSNQAMGVTMIREARKSNNQKTKTKKQNRKAESPKRAQKHSARSEEAAKAPRRQSSKSPGRKPASHKANSSKPDSPSADAPKSPVPDPEPGQAADRLRKSLKSKVSTQFEDIAQALINTTVKGNMTGARLIVELTGADKPSPEEKDPEVVRLNLPDPELLAAEPEWKDPEIGDIWVGDHWESPSKPADSNT